MKTPKFISDVRGLTYSQHIAKQPQDPMSSSLHSSATSDALHLHQCRWCSPGSRRGYILLLAGPRRGSGIFGSWLLGCCAPDAQLEACPRAHGASIWQTARRTLGGSRRTPITRLTMPLGGQGCRTSGRRIRWLACPWICGGCSSLSYLGRQNCCTGQHRLPAQPVTCAPACITTNSFTKPVAMAGESRPPLAYQHWRVVGLFAWNTQYSVF